MSGYQPTVSGELEPDVTRRNILNYCNKLWPSTTWSMTTGVCQTCHRNGHEQYQAYIIAANRGQVFIKSACKNSEEALLNLYLWVQNHWAWRPEMMH